MCHFLAESLSALGEFTSKKVAFLKLTCGEQPCTKPVGFAFCKESWAHLEWTTCGVFINQITLQCSAVLLLTALCFVVGTVKNTNGSCTRFKLAQWIHGEVILGTGSTRGSLFAEICAAWFSPGLFSHDPAMTALNEENLSPQYFIALQSMVTCQVLMAMELHQACCIPFPLCFWQRCASDSRQMSSLGSFLGGTSCKMHLGHLCGKQECGLFVVSGLHGSDCNQNMPFFSCAS